MVAITSRAVDEASRPGGLTFQQWRVLVVLGGADTGMRISELARRLGASGPSTSRIVRRLERHGLVELVRDQVDRRAVRATLSVGGSALRQKVIDRRRDLIVATVEVATYDDSMADRLSALARHFDAWV